MERYEAFGAAAQGWSEKPSQFRHGRFSIAPMMDWSYNGVNHLYGDRQSISVVALS